MQHFHVTGHDEDRKLDLWFEAGDDDNFTPHDALVHTYLELRGNVLASVNEHKSLVQLRVGSPSCHFILGKDLKLECITDNITPHAFKPMQQVLVAQILSLLSVSVQRRVLELACSDESDGIILFENVTLDSSHLGERTVMCFGASRTYKKSEDVKGRWLHDLPSQRMYPQVWAANPIKFKGVTT